MQKIPDIHFVLYFFSNWRFYSVDWGPFFSSPGLAMEWITVPSFSPCCSKDKPLGLFCINREAPVTFVENKTEMEQLCSSYNPGPWSGIPKHFQAVTGSPADEYFCVHFEGREFSGTCVCVPTHRDTHIHTCICVHLVLTLLEKTLFPMFAPPCSRWS